MITCRESEKTFQKMHYLIFIKIFKLEIQDTLLNQERASKKKIYSWHNWSINNWWLKDGIPPPCPNIRKQERVYSLIRDNRSLVPCYCNKMNIAIKASVNFFVSQGMPKWCLHYTLAQLCYVKKKKKVFRLPLKNTLLLKKPHHHLTMQIYYKLSIC